MRSDGRKVKKMDPMYFLIPHFLAHRYDAMNMITLDIPVEPMKKYMNRRRNEDGVHLSHVALVIAAYLRAAAEFPALNRFVGNKTVYAHKDFVVSMVVLRPGDTESTMGKVSFDFADDVDTVQKKINDYIEESREVQDNPLDKLMNVLKNIPVVLNLVGGILRFMDRHGILPKALIKVSPFHASLLISNLASIRTNHIYHHVYEFGTTSVAITMGNMREVPRKSKGEIVLDRCIPLGVVMDERIASGHYFAGAFSRIKSYLNDPSQLEGPPKFEIIPDE